LHAANGICFAISIKNKGGFMKRFFTLSILTVLALTTMAQWGPNNPDPRDNRWGQTRFSISSMSNRPIRVMIDGQWIQDQSNEIRLSHLRPGMHTVQIYATNRNNRWDRDNRGRGNNRNGDLIYNVNLNIRSGMHTDILINRFGKVFVDEQTIDSRWDDNWNNGGNNGNGGWNNNGGWNGGRFGQPMDNNSFQQLKQMIEKEAFDDNKLTLLRTVLPNNGISSSQVRELMQQMSFEQNKLELAKFAYRFTTDRNNYFMVNDVFNFSHSKNELSTYILNYRD
jgi:Domain of unknown function (DUF4476)